MSVRSSFEIAESTVPLRTTTKVEHLHDPPEERQIAMRAVTRIATFSCSNAWKYGAGTESQKQLDVYLSALYQCITEKRYKDAINLSNAVCDEIHSYGKRLDTTSPLNDEIETLTSVDERKGGDHV